MRFGLLASNFAILIVIMAFVLHNPQTDDAAKKPIVVDGTAAPTTVNPLDQVSSADIALTVARMNGLPETTAISNQAQSQAAEVAVATSSHNVVVSKPQVVETALKSSADIKDYTAEPGDTVPGIASKFGVTSDSIRWSNNLAADAVTPGTRLVIPPVNGVVYIVGSGDTPDSLATRFQASKDKIIAYNDAEINGLTLGQRIIIPDAAQVSPAASRSAAAINAARGSFAWGNAPMYGGGGYDYGYCTWYVAKRLPVPGNWGNANTWAYYAPASGWSVSKRPVKGAVGQSTAGYYGHVAVIEDVSEDGTMIKYSDMNGLRGFAREGTTPDWVPASKFNNYIYR